MLACCTVPVAHTWTVVPYTSGVNCDCLPKGQSMLVVICLHKPGGLSQDVGGCQSCGPPMPWHVPACTRCTLNVVFSYTLLLLNMLCLYACEVTMVVIKICGAASGTAVRSDVIALVTAPRGQPCDVASHWCTTGCSTLPDKVAEDDPCQMVHLSVFVGLLGCYVS